MPKINPSGPLTEDSLGKRSRPVRSPKACSVDLSYGGAHAITQLKYDKKETKIAQRLWETTYRRFQNFIIGHPRSERTNAGAFVVRVMLSGRCCQRQGVRDMQMQMTRDCLRYGKGTLRTTSLFQHPIGTVLRSHSIMGFPRACLTGQETH